MRNKRAGKKFPPSMGMRTPSNQKHKQDPRPKARPADTWDDQQVSRGNSAWYRAMNRMIEKGMSEREIVQSISKKFKIDPMAIKKEIRISRMANEMLSDSDGNYMSVQNIQTILSAAQFLAEMIQDGDEMEDWVDDCGNKPNFLSTLLQRSPPKNPNSKTYGSRTVCTSHRVSK